MIFKYICGLGVPHKNRIVRDGDGLVTLFEEVGSDNGGLIKVTSADLKLQLLFRISDGLFVGLTYKGEPQKQARLQRPCFFDGALSIDLKGRYVTDQCAYLDFRNGSVLYDSQSNAVLFGVCPEGCMAVRVCRNAYVCMTDGGAVGGVLVDLSEQN